MKNSFSSIGAKMWSSVANSDRALAKYQFKDILLNHKLDILTQENTYVAVHTLVEMFHKRDHYDVIIMVFMARFLFNHGYACSGGRHLVDCVFFQSEPSTRSVIYI